MSRPETIRIAVVNQSLTLSDHDAAAGVAALQKQVSEDFGPVWNVDATLEFAGKDRLKERLPDHWGLILVDDQAQSEQLGYHHVTASGQPLAVVLVSSVPGGQDWTHAASHELLEMLADPTADMAVYSRPNEATQRVYAREVCDPCAAYEDGYVVAGMQVADFVFPSWFHTPGGRVPAAGTTRYDERGLIEAPLQLRPGGYIGVLDPGTFSWSRLDSTSGTPTVIPATSRLQLRAIAREEWQLSDMDWIP
jgi:hypothetical protein